jgi:hypothetical protein
MSEVRADFNPKPGRLPPGHISTMMYGEEGEATMRAGEGGFSTTQAVGEDGNRRWYTTHAVGEEGYENTTKAVGEEGDDRVSTMRVGEEGELTMTPSGSEGGEWYTTQAVGEEGEFTRRIGEAGDNRVSTMAVGEEGEDPGVPSNPILLDPINNQYNRLLELLKKILQRLINNKGIGIGFPPIINPNPPIDYYPNPIVGRDYTNSMPKIIKTGSARIEHAYLPEAE